MEQHEKFMRRCLQLANKGTGRVAPNPKVGCVVVNDGKIIGEGWHQAFGGAHAEVNALSAIGAGAVPSGSTLYVNLEPCAHHGKTPPCAELLIKEKVDKVIIGTQDPFPQVAGKGIALLTSAGIEVITGVLEEECRKMNAHFFCAIEKKRPYITLKWAMSRDGFVAPNTDPQGRSFRLTSQEMDVHTHAWRVEHQGILVGSRTVISDNPSLLVRHVQGRSPVRFTIDRAGSIPASAALFSGDPRTIVLGKCANDQVECVPLNGRDPLDVLLETCVNESIHSLYVEGGPSLHKQFLARDYWDELRAITCPLDLEAGIPAAGLPPHLDHIEQLGEETISYYFNG